MDKSGSAKLFCTFWKPKATWSEPACCYQSVSEVTQSELYFRDTSEMSVNLYKSWKLTCRLPVVFVFSCGAFLRLFTARSVGCHDNQDSAGRAVCDETKENKQVVVSGSTASSPPALFVTCLPTDKDNWHWRTGIGYEILIREVLGNNTPDTSLSPTFKPHRENITQAKIYYQLLCGNNTHG